MDTSNRLSRAGSPWAGFFYALSLLLASAACISCTACAPASPGEAESLNLVVWNLEAFFDGEECGTEYRDYTEAEGWTDAKYRHRLMGLEAAMKAMREAGAGRYDGSPDLLALIEIENDEVLRDLVSGPFSGSGYTHSAVLSIPGSPLTLGLLSRFPILEARSHAAAFERETVPRPLFEVRIDAGGVPLVLFLCHWKSKLGGADSTEALRLASSRSLALRSLALATEEPGLGLLVLGDLNENWDEFSLRGGNVLTALLPDSGEAAALAAGEASGSLLVLTGKQPPVSGYFEGAAAFFSPWPDSPWPGSYWYDGAWETIDHALASPSLFDGGGWEWGSFSVLAVEPFVNGEGFPDAYNPRTGKGLSDHLPLRVELRKSPVEK